VAQDEVGSSKRMRQQPAPLSRRAAHAITVAASSGGVSKTVEMSGSPADGGEHGALAFLIPAAVRFQTKADVLRTNAVGFKRAAATCVRVGLGRVADVDGAVQSIAWRALNSCSSCSNRSS
jgi:hypothetical protein